ncbi:MAG: hypothetical protein WBG73_06795 [Coleofasciculaceae cyanobacterium]
MFFSKSSAILVGGAIFVGVVLPSKAISQAMPPVVSQPLPTTPQLLVIQGKVQNIRNYIITVKTPDYFPYCPPNYACPAVMAQGPTFNVDISRAIFQSPTGKKMPRRQRLKLQIGDAIVVAGSLVVSSQRLKPNSGIVPQFLKANIVSKAISSIPTRVP